MRAFVSHVRLLVNNRIRLKTRENFIEKFLGLIVYSEPPISGGTPLIFSIEACDPPVSTLPEQTGNGHVRGLSAP
jgi:hypothetical protein